MKNTNSASSQTMVEHAKEEKIKTKKKSKLPDKEFKMRNSILTDLFENQHIKTVHHIFIALFIGLLVNTLALDYFNYKKITLGLRLINIGFNKIHIALITWTIQFLNTCLCYVFFNIWARTRNKFQPKFKHQKIWDVSWGTSLFLYYIFGFRIASEAAINFKLPIASAAIVTLETIRMLMKVHAFVRENVPKVTSYKPHSEEKLILPEFSKFLYFLFAPTLIYRDHYPRTTHIRWKFVAENLIYISLIIFAYSFVFENTLIPWFGEFGQRTYTIWEVLLCACQACIPAMLLKLCTFYLVLHCWQNMFAELLTFGDRLFYLDWWTVTTYGEYFRTWNILVGDWLYVYIYKDVYEIVFPKNKFAAKASVFLISAIVHEWVLTYMYGFFFPFLFVLFLFFGSILSYVKISRSNFMNILFWYGLSVGSGILVTVYTLEFMARSNMAIENPSNKDFFIPKCFSFIEI